MKNCNNPHCLHFAVFAVCSSEGILVICKTATTANCTNYIYKKEEL